MDCEESWWSALDTPWIVRFKCEMYVHSVCTLSISLYLYRCTKSVQRRCYACMHHHTLPAPSSWMPRPQNAIRTLFFAPGRLNLHHIEPRPGLTFSSPHPPQADYHSHWHSLPSTRDFLLESPAYSPPQSIATRASAVNTRY